MPSDIELPDSLLAVLLIDRDMKRSLFTTLTENDVSKDGQRRNRTKKDLAATMIAWYRITVGGDSGFPHPALTDPEPDKPKQASSTPHAMTESHMCSSEFKCHALRRDAYEAYALYVPSIPTFALRAVTAEVMGKLVVDSVFALAKE